MASWGEFLDKLNKGEVTWVDTSPFVIGWLNYCTDQLTTELSHAGASLPIGDKGAYNLSVESGASDFQARVISWCPREQTIDEELGRYFNTHYLRDLVAVIRIHSE